MMFLKNYRRTVLMIFLIVSLPDKIYSDGWLRGVLKEIEDTQLAETSDFSSLDQTQDEPQVMLPFDEGSNESLKENCAHAGCPCTHASACNSGRCEGYFSRTCIDRLQNGESCNEHNDCESHNCNWSYTCAELVRKAEGESCTESYECEHGFYCSSLRCTSNQELVTAVTGQTCEGASQSGDEIKVMTYNVFLLHDMGLIGHIGGWVTGESLLARDGASRQRAVDGISQWLKDTKTDVDVILVQELFDNTPEFKAGMIEAGYCNHVVDERYERTKSGLAIFSKIPIIDYDFWYWCDRNAWTPMCGGGGETAADKGIMYAKLQRGNDIIHVTNTHTTSDSLGDAHSVRMLQYAHHVTMMNVKNPNSDALTLMGGDFNENYYEHDKYDSESDSYGTHTGPSPYYQEMLPVLKATAFPTVGEGMYTYDSVVNPVLHQVYEERNYDGEYREVLDYIFVYDSTLSDDKIAESQCEILSSINYSDHYPRECTIKLA